MDLYKNLYKNVNLAVVRSEPDVWVSRIIIFERVTPHPVVIRDIALSRGLNIIWAKEAEDDDPTTRITGHSAGKTTFCRLLRYVLGDRTFGSKAVMELIRKAFPDGYIAAELHVRGRKWAVRRPFGSGRMSCIKEDASIEELLEQRGRSVTLDSYPQDIGLESLLDELETGGIVRTGEPIQWDHILAWCTRDQEARFQNIHDWRSPRSESDTPAFRFPKAGPLFVMRAVLGLFLPDELKGEERLAELQHEKDRLTKEIEDKKREPQFRVNLYDYQLRQSLKSFLPDESDIDSRPFRSDEVIEDLERLTSRAQKTIDEPIENTKQERRALQDQIDDLGAEIRWQERELAELDTLFNLNTAADRELDAGLSKHEEQRKRIEEIKDSKCPLGNVVFRDCSHIQKLQSILQMTEHQDAHAMKQAEDKRKEEKKRIENDKSDLQATIDRLQSQRSDLQKKRESLGKKFREKEQKSHDLKRTCESLGIWTKRLDREVGYEELVHLRKELNDTNRAIEKHEKELTGLLRKHDANSERLSAIFSGAVRAVLSSDKYDGQVNLENRELAFRITHGPAMSGEAVQTLSVLLADVACLVYNAVSDKARLPGFLMHDSPREADLDIGIYKSFIRFAASLQEHFGGPDKCPFQYLITTTTAPPEEMQTDPEEMQTEPKKMRTEGYVKLRLNASTDDGLLLRRNIALSTKLNISMWELQYEDKTSSQPV